MAVYHIESITIRDKSVIPLRVQCEATIDYQSTHEVTGDQEVVQYKGDVLGVDQSTYFTRMRMDDGTTVDLRNSDIISVFQEYDVETGSTIYWGASLVPPPNLGKLTDVYISKSGDCYSLTETGWKLQTNIRGPVGATGASPKIGVNGNWFIDGKDSGIPARGDNGKDGASPIIDSTTKHWFLKGVDLGVCAEGQTPYIGTNGNWWIGTTDTGVTASGSSLLPAIDPTTKHWIVDGKDTGIIAEGHDGKTPYIDPTTKHWFINGTDTGVVAEGVGGTINVSINTTTQNWEIDGVDTGIPATGPQGPAGAPGQDGKSFQLFAVYENTTDMDTDEPNVPENSFVALITETDILLYIKSHGYTPGANAAPDSRPNFIWVKNLTDMISIAGVPGKDGVTPHIDPVTKHWMVGTKDTGVNAEPPIPYIGANNNWWIGTTDTGVSALGSSGITPTIDPTTKHWMLGTVDTGVLAEATLPTINPTTKNWMINGVDTGIHAVGQDGLTPYIGGNGHWFVGATDTGVSASGAFPVIDAKTNHWFIDGVDTGVSAVGPAGKAPTITIDPTTKNWMIDGLDTGISSVGANGITPTIGANGNWFIGPTDTGVNAQGVSGITPHIDPTTKHWMIGTTDTGVSAEGKIDEKELQSLKNRLNALIGSKHTCRQYDWLFATRNVLSAESTVTTGVNWFSLLPDIRGTMKLSSDWYVTLSPNRTYKLYASSSAATLGHAFRWTDRNGKIYFPYGLTSRNTTCTPSVVIIEVGDDPIDITCLWDTAAAGRVALGYTSLVIEEFGYQYDIDPVEYIMHEDGIEDTPVGTIIPYMGTGIPKHYLPCDGTILNIDDYPDLSAHFVEQFGKAEHFGGDGVTTFAVPDLRGEFLRGTGANSHKEQGNGAAVGTHQDGTVHPSFKVWASHRLGLSNKNSSTGIATFSNQDSSTWGSDVFERRFSNYNTSSNAANTDIGYTSRPTNTSVQWLIKCERTPFLQIGGGSAITDVSKEPGNLIEEKSDGIFVDVPISAEPDNILEKKDDGMYVPDVPEEIRLKVNLLSRAKHTTEEVQFFFAMETEANDTSRPTITAGVSFLKYLTTRQGNMRVSDDGNSIILDKGKTYWIECFAIIQNGGSYFIYNTDTNEKISSMGYFQGSVWGTSPAIAVVTATDKMRIDFRSADNRGALAKRCSYVFVEEINKPKEIDPVEYVMGTDGIEASPVGSIISYMGTTPPQHYIACDGTEYPIADYAQLAQHFIDQFGKVDYFGGDGVDTFAVPDLRNEFIRGYHGESADKLSGEIGIHQEATAISDLYLDRASRALCFSTTGGNHRAFNPDTTDDPSGSKTDSSTGNGTSGSWAGECSKTFTVRPTNTAVLFCIKYESTPFVQINSKVVGVEVDEEVFRQSFTDEANGTYSYTKSVEGYDELWVGVFSSTATNYLLTQKSVPVSYLPKGLTMHHHGIAGNAAMVGGRSISVTLADRSITVDDVTLNGNTGVEIVVRAKKYTPVTPGAGGVSGISKEDGNIIVEKSDGIYAAGPDISKETDNILEKKNDGLFVAPTSISAEEGNEIIKKSDGLFVDSHVELKKRINRLYTGKYGNLGEPGFFQVHRQVDPTEIESVSITAGQNILSKYSKYDTNMEVDNNGCVKLLGGHRYRLAANIFISRVNASCVFMTNDGTPIGSFCYATRTTDGDPVPSGESLVALYEPDVDVYVALKMTATYPANTTGSLRKLYTSVVIEEIEQFREIDPVEYLMDNEKIEDSPIGEIISYMGTTPPAHYIACDGAIRPIVEFPQLAEHFRVAFGSVNHFGGDGIDTFAVPNLNGEFLRGSGANGHANQGSGGPVGSHQNATIQTAMLSYSNKLHVCNANNASSGINTVEADGANCDFAVSTRKYASAVTLSAAEKDDGYASSYTSRPTNTSVLYCIKYERTPFAQIRANALAVTKNEQLLDTALADNGTYSLNHPISNYDEIWFGIMSDDTNRVLMREKRVPAELATRKIILDYVSVASATSVGTCRQVWLTVSDTTIASTINLYGASGIRLVVRGIRYINIPDGPVSVPLSKETGNIAEIKDDGLYVPNLFPDVSTDTDNAIETKEDGLFVKKEVVYTDEEINEAVMEIFFPEKIMLEQAKASTPKTLEELDDIFAEAPNNALGSYMIAPVEGEIPEIE